MFFLLYPAGSVLISCVRAFLIKFFSIAIPRSDKPVRAEERLSTLNSVKERGSHGALRSQLLSRIPANFIWVPDLLFRAVSVEKCRFLQKMQKGSPQ